MSEDSLEWASGEEPVKKQKIENKKEKEESFKHRMYAQPEEVERYCDILGDRLLTFAVEYNLKKDNAFNPALMISLWETGMRQPIEKHMQKEMKLEANVLEDIFTSMMEMNKRLDLYS